MQCETDRPDGASGTPRRIRWVCAAYAVLLTLVLLLPKPWALFGVAQPPSGPGDKPIHLVAFLILAALLEASRPPWPFPITVGLLVGYALLTEFAQHLLPVRTFEAMDLVQDLAGIALGLAFSRWWIRRKRRRSDASP
jgi:VanZ family protein